MNEMKHALRASVVIAIFGKAACKHGLCLIIRINKKNWNKNSEIRKSFSSFYFAATGSMHCTCRKVTGENIQTYFRKHMFTNANICAKMNRNICFFERAVGHGDDMGQSSE